jgi:hypothetical protein
VCAEADPKQAAVFRTDDMYRIEEERTSFSTLRTCTIVDKAISIAAGKGAIRGDAWGGKVEDGGTGSGRMDIDITTMQEVLEASKWEPDASGRVLVDFISLDVEEHELEVLMAMPWEKLNIRFAVIEDNKAKTDLWEYLQDQGYVKIASLQLDDVFARLPPGEELTLPSASVNIERVETATLRKRLGTDVYLKQALHKGWDYVKDYVSKHHAIPTE